MKTARLITATTGKTDAAQKADNQSLDTLPDDYPPGEVPCRDENVDDAPPADVSPRNVHLSDVDPADGPPSGDSHSAAQPCDDHADDAPASNIPLEDLPHHEHLEDDEGSLDETDDEASDRPSERKWHNSSHSLGRSRQI